MKINMDQILTGENNFNTIQDSLKIFKYKNELNKYLDDGLNDRNWLTDFYYSYLPECLKDLNIYDTLFIREYYSTSLFPYLYEKLCYYNTTLDKILNITPNEFTGLRNYIITDKNEIFGLLKKLTNHANTEQVILEEFLKNIYSSFVMINKLGDLDSILIAKGTNLSFLFKLRDLCIEILSSIEFPESEEKKDEN